MSIILAKSAGFCFGVERAINTVYQLVNQNKEVFTLGPVTHNPQVIEELSKKGVKVLDDIKDLPKGATLVIRAHGVAPHIIDEIEKNNISYVDATCPFVTKIQNLVKAVPTENSCTFILGDRHHPEIIGIVGCCKSEYYVFKDNEELEKTLKHSPELCKKNVHIYAQTTFNTKEWEKCLKTIKKLCTNASTFDTICKATVERQAEARSLARQSDMMIIIGGKESSNTKKLFDVCSEYCKTYLITTKDEIPKIQPNLSIGITAGASTPASIIKEVLVTMTDMIETKENFEEMLEESLKSLNTDEKVRGVVVGISPNEVYVDVGRKQAGFIPIAELSQDPNAKVEDLVKIGDEIELLIMKTNDQEGTIMLSKRRIDAIKGWEDLAAAAESEEVLTAKVTEVVKGGVIVVSSGVRVFIPASQATANRGDSLEDLKGTEVSFRIIEVNRQRRRAVGSIRSVLREERKANQEKFWNEIEEGQEFTGTVKSLTSFGAFVDLGAVDGMVHISELSWNRIKHPSEVVAVGDTVSVYIKELNKETKRISLGYKKSEDNPWEILKDKYPVGTVCDVTIVSMTTFGAFAKIIPGIDGLIHISQISDKRIEKPNDVLKVGEVVTAAITDIDFDSKRVSLSIRALIEAEEASEETEEEVSE